ncbi:CPBP family intramembrane glutamic endopeptidase [Paenibacillus sp. MMS20-IR301]|uniref:CPBP family intramembrane glutamic endopeptidase n=1 Tax=Paenibacillus sp. MMS20-IR301 TaxID=2895946 RepID=UPI0028E9982D|nr:CPBP family intramembrane glutamic endopeptidase [Paenibacillus sp. MMS20-IR301]WNS46127.1 CPBP family intramembrane glutamic endopeptidase [Paenibacillus sp. MMS20-IR301]
MTTLQSKLTFSQKHPIWTVVIIQLLLLLAMTAAGAVATIRELSDKSPVWISFIPIAIVLMLYFTLKRKWSLLGFRSLSTIPSGNWIYYAPLLLILVINGIKGFREISVSEVLVLLLFTLLVGFVEESLYRGLILKTLLAKGVTTAVITSSVLFGLTHILNSLSGQDVGQTILQIVYALLMGVVLALLVVKDNNIIPVILFHFLHNLLQYVGNDNSSAFLGYDLLILALLAGHAVWLIFSLRKSTPSAYAASSSIH